MKMCIRDRGYVSIETNHGEVQFCIDGIFADEKETSSFDLSLFEVFEDDFARPLSQMEVELLSQWTMEYLSLIHISLCVL